MECGVGAEGKEKKKRTVVFPLFDSCSRTALRTDGQTKPLIGLRVRKQKEGGTKKESGGRLLGKRTFCFTSNTCVK